MKFRDMIEKANTDEDCIIAGRMDKFVPRMGGR